MGITRFRAHVGPQRNVKNASEARKAMDATVRYYQKFVRHMETESPDVLLEALEPAFDLSQYYCPVATGAMKDSGYLVIAQRGQYPTVEIGYGKFGKPPYTVAVHENMEWKHKNPTRSKWLQTALAEEASEIQQRITLGYKKAGGF
jgi:hypothetical protein